MGCSPWGREESDVTEATEDKFEHAHPCIPSFTYPFIPPSHPSRRQPGLSAPSLWIRPFWTLDRNMWESYKRYSLWPSASGSVPSG